MEHVIAYRHNVITMDSLETFCGVHGGITGACRDVYFVRALGECSDFLNVVHQTQLRLQDAAQRGNLKYARIRKLPALTDSDVVADYAGIYEKWKRNEPFMLLHLKEEALSSCMAKAMGEAIEQYQKAKPGASESMIKNFGVKLLFWTDMVLSDLLRGWTPKSCFKLLADNVCREQEYLFYYFATLLGCDVLLLQNKKDVDVGDTLKQLSQTLTLGAFGTTEPDAHTKPVRLDVSRVKKPSRTGISVRSEAGAPECPDASSQAKEQSNPAVTGQSNSVSAGRQEKSFEELAMLASSVVMIAVHDESGEVTGTGSGIMIGEKGFILTNHHVIAGGRYYSVRIEEDEQIYSTHEIIKDNYHLDLAVIRIQRMLTPIPVYKGPKKLVRGQKVVAIGSPLGMFNSVSDGIISGFRRIDEVNMIQFTAPTSPGSSGGAVLNMYGEVIGISTAGMDRGQNINLAVHYEDILSFARGFYA